MTESTAKVNLLGLSPRQLESFFEELGEKRFRATQVLKWMHQLGASSFDEMTNISKALRAKLAEVAEIREPEIVVEKFSKDGTRKWVIRMDGGSAIEMVLIPDGDRKTLCVSSQVGCSLDCSFCSTGKQGFNRDLSTAEIIGQLRVAIRSFGPFDPSGERRVTNVVFMGMGEPLMNFDNVVAATELMMDDNAYGLSKRRVTLSTSGVVPALDRLREVSDVSLAVSLHAPNDELRNELVPINRRYPIDELIAACNRYLEGLNDKRVVTVEYTLIAGVNDQPEHARQLVKVLRKLPCKLNLIPFNPFPNSGYSRPTEEAIQAFKQIMLSSHVLTTVRRTRGDDVDAACGQLVGQVQDRTRRSQKYIAVVQEEPVQGKSQAL
ncbi:Ribosomal RNA large subunit methyltransferase N [Marinobacterium lacunae]|uniref:Dual-specificity RNA methyltransferase RlmN n=1 Tax=Marinobacterium lacunae TaxID=1232683 RepID=A0A081G265_9GAMM|nr:23S rRNA (adenine(2503)-C(2))-methyltransferase RlmN [Marinobacterium lacunae]KEA64870.1 Ribosomal RNA large subunit methyltransferase N [Marinobacterium lacunae]MBR9884290.1 23S rRNA (adenine(2503)-C(2))-methyltransferase RlmN [Oceanospirillales bacterium]